GAALAQVPGVPLEPLNGLDALLLAYVAQVAAWCAAPDWAELEVHLSGLGLLVAYAGLAAGVVFCWRLPPHALVLGMLALAVVVPLPGGGGAEAGPPPGLRVEVLDVGQGDAILFRPAGAPAVLVDGGPPGDGLERKLEEAGVEQLGAVVATHDQSDHVGGIEELLGRMPVGRLVYARLGRDLVSRAAAAGAKPVGVAAGRELRSGRLRLRVLWPPPELLTAPVDDPNQLALVIEARWRDFTMLLTADAEAESVPIEAGPVDVLKVAHHGSEDAGLGPLLDRIRPRLAVISAGSDNPYGHPAPQTLATLERHGVQTLRTDEEGVIKIDVNRHEFGLDGYPNRK
ncbi:MAG TPA: MBL fold metallo-hydrolase, partial [Solirubrobacterales bacterium]|nr:MBL fold metallo-hydrolase [Solirubrobacterales bacterium]